jgi:uncharacterized protein YbjQ (UPF0145 family)
MTHISSGQMLVITTPSIPGWRITGIFGLVSGEAIIGANVMRDIFASITDIIGGRSGAYEGALEQAKQHALNDMRAGAHKLGANAVIGCDLDYEHIGGMLMVCASGTAVRIESESDEVVETSTQ